MKTDTILILDREDMISDSKHTKTSDISRYDIKYSLKNFDNAGIVLFLDDNGDFKILKNRYGN